VEVGLEVYDGYGDMEMVDRSFIIDWKSKVFMIMDF
jgi:hypothetical protein